MYCKIHCIEKKTDTIYEYERIDRNSKKRTRKLNRPWMNSSSVYIKCLCVKCAFKRYRRFIAESICLDKGEHYICFLLHRVIYFFCVFLVPYFGIFIRILFISMVFVTKMKLIKNNTISIKSQNYTKSIFLWICE